MKAETAPSRPQRFFLDAGEYSIRDLITKSGEFLGRTYLYNPAENPTFENAHVEIPRRLDLDANGCEEVVSQLLYTQQYTMSPLDPARGIYEWIYLPGARRIEVKKRATFVPWEQVVARPNLKTYVMTAFPLKHIDASRATNSMRPFFQTDQTGLDNMAPIGNSNTILITGFRDTVAEIVKMLGLVDEPPPKIEGGVEERLQKLEAKLQALEEALKKK